MNDDTQTRLRRRWAKALWAVVIIGALLMTPRIMFWPAVAVVATILAVRYARPDRKSDHPQPPSEGNRP